MRRLRSKMLGLGHSEFLERHVKVVDPAVPLAAGCSRACDHAVEHHVADEEHARVTVDRPALARVAAQSPVGANVLGEAEIGNHQDSGAGLARGAEEGQQDFGRLRIPKATSTSPRPISARVSPNVAPVAGRSRTSGRTCISCQ